MSWCRILLRYLRPVPPEVCAQDGFVANRHVVLGCGPPRGASVDQDTWYSLFKEIALEPCPAGEARRLLAEPVQGVYEWEPEALHGVISRAEGCAHRLQPCALEVVNQMLAVGRLRIAPPGPGPRPRRSNACRVVSSDPLFLRRSGSTCEDELCAIPM